MKVDVTKIDGYEDMTAEQKLEAVLNFEVEAPTDEVTKLKNLLNKANSEAAENKRKLKEFQEQKLSEEERAKLEREESERALREENEALKKAQKLSEYKANYLANGYGDELAGKTAEALLNGDMATVFANQKTFAESVKAKAKEELLNSNPDLSKGKPPVEKDYDSMTDAEYYEAIKNK